MSGEGVAADRRESLHDVDMSSGHGGQVFSPFGRDVFRGLQIGGSMQNGFLDNLFST